MNNTDKNQTEAQRIIQDTYNTNPKVKEQIDYYNLGLENVGITIYSHHPHSTKAQIVNEYNLDAPIMLSYSMEDKRAVRQSVSFIHPLTENR